MHSKFYIILLSLKLLVAISFAQPVRVQTSIDKKNIQIGDQITLQFSATYSPQEYRVSFPTLADTFNHFEVVERSNIDTSLSNQETSFTQKIIITSFDSGVWKLPSYLFLVQPLNGQDAYSIPSDTFLIQVSTIAVDTSKPPKAIFDIQEASLPLTTIIMYVVLAVLAIAAVGLLLWYLIKKYRNRTKNNTESTLKVYIPPHEKALKTLQEIENHALWQADEKNYHTQLTDVLRTYLQEQFDIDCFEKTSSEIVQVMKKNKILSPFRKQLGTLLALSDLVKFAKSKPTEEEHIQSLQQARIFVTESYSSFIRNAQINTPTPPQNSQSK